MLEGTAGTDAGGDEASVRFVIDAVNKDVTALCDYATAEYRKELARTRTARRPCSTNTTARCSTTTRCRLTATTAAATDGERTVTLERQKDGSWLITDVR